MPKTLFKEAPDGHMICNADYDDYMEQYKKTPEYKREEQELLRKEEEKKEERQINVRRMNLKTRYNMSPEEFDTMVLEQEHRCANCQRVQMRFVPLSEKGKTIALLCRKCGNLPKEDLSIKVREAI